MSRRTRIHLALALAVAVIAALWWLRSAPPPAPPPPAESSGTATAPAPSAARPDRAPTPAPAAATAPEPSREPSATHAPAGGEEHAPDPQLAEELAWYRQHPMSSVPHTVVRAWGARPDSPHPGVVGLYIAVAPDLPSEELEKLLRDVREYHRDADALTLRVVDTEEAATYDWHVDAREFLDRHLVAMLHRNVQLGVDSMQMRGVDLDPNP